MLFSEVIQRLTELMAKYGDKDITDEVIPPEPVSPPTLEQLVKEIESGPLSMVLAIDWGDVFPPHPTLLEKLKHREGQLKCDAAFAIHRLLTTAGKSGQSRSEELGWGNGWSWKLVRDAHEALRRGK